MMFATQYFHEFMLNISVVYLFMEVSTLFSTPRWLMFEHKVPGGSWAQSINSVGLFVVFFYARIYFQSSVILTQGAPWFFHMRAFKDETYQAFGWLCVVTVLINAGMNYFWFSLILKQVYRVYKRGLQADQAYAEEIDGTKPQPKKVGQQKAQRPN